jgi:cytosine/adenosine deaminase-related metal-dependent hydrolase
MSAEIENSEQPPRFIFTSEEADQLVSEALDTDSCEPEAFVRLLLILLDHTQEPCLKEAFRELVKAAYNRSIVYSIHLCEYIDAVKQGQNVVEETRARWLAHQQSEI